MNKYLDFENDIEHIESVLNKLDVNKSNYRVEKNKLLVKKKKINKQNLF